MSSKKWKMLRRLVELKSAWVTVYADEFTDENGNSLEYWHVDRADSVIVLALHNGHFLLPQPQYRPGVDEVTIDFAGGRLKKREQPAEAAATILKRELGIKPEHIQSLEPLLTEALHVDSSFSTQKLYGFVAEIAPQAVPLPGARIHPMSKIEPLRQKLHCLQCRALLNEFVLQWQKELLS